MTVAELEQRVSTLEQAVVRLRTLEQVVAQLQEQVTTLPRETPNHRTHREEISGEEDLIPGAEYPLVLAVQPESVVRVTGQIVSITPGPRGLALSDTEWDSIKAMIESDHE